MGLTPKKASYGYTRVNQIQGTTGDFGIQMQGPELGMPSFMGPGGFMFMKTGRVITPLDCKKQVFNVYNNGGEQNFTVPKGVSYIYVKIWGSGGGGGCQGGWTHGADGGAGGHTRGLLKVSGDDVLNIRVAPGGVSLPPYGKPTALGGGGAILTNQPYVPAQSPTGSYGMQDHRYCGGGGGYSGIFIASTPMMIAGGGGGGGSHSGTWNHWPRGGAGGGARGQDGWTSGVNWDYQARDQGGGGGSQSGGGSGSQAHNSHMGVAGAYLQGGSAYGNYMYGGSGGGGYFGGGAGSHTMGGGVMSGGGGGSGYLHPRVLMGETFTGHRQYPPLTEDPDYQSNGGKFTNIAMGGDICSYGGEGLVVLYY